MIIIKDNEGFLTKEKVDLLLNFIDNELKIGYLINKIGDDYILT